MPNLNLVVAADTRARVPAIAFGKIEVPFETDLIRTAANQPKAPSKAEGRYVASR